MQYSAPNSESCPLNISSVLRPILIYGRGAAANFSPKSAGGEWENYLQNLFPIRGPSASADEREEVKLNKFASGGKKRGEKVDD